VGEKRKSGHITRLDVTAALASLRSLVSDTLKTLVPHPDQPNCSMSSEDAQMVKVQLTALHRKTQAEYHTLRDDIQRLVAAAETKPLQLLQDDLQELHVASTPCQGLHRMRPRLFCQPSCRHTEPWESCPNQIPTHMAQLQKPRSRNRPHILGADTPDITDTPGTPSYSSALSTRRCHHPSVRCWRRVQDTAGLSHPHTQRGVTVASCGARCDRLSASRARM
jgi:hypothetical protein